MYLNKSVQNVLKTIPLDVLVLWK